MTFPQAVGIIDKHQQNINDQIIRCDDVFAPDEYYLAVSATLPVLKCLSCITDWTAGDTTKQFVPCNKICANNCTHSHSQNHAFMNPPQCDADELPFG